MTLKRAESIDEVRVREICLRKSVQTVILMSQRFDPRTEPRVPGNRLRRTASRQITWECRSRMLAEKRERNRSFYKTIEARGNSEGENFDERNERPKPL